jgi:uncharacterized OsmC-like protein
MRWKLYRRRYVVAEEELVNTVRSTTTNVHGRTLNSAGVHHFIIDGPSTPNEEIVSMDAFLAGISSCATHLMEDFAAEEGIPLERATVTIRAVRPAAEPERFERIDLHLELVGPTTAQAEHLVERFKGR